MASKKKKNNKKECSIKNIKHARKREKKKINAIKCVLMPNINDGIYGKTNYNHIKKKIQKHIGKSFVGYPNI